MTIIMGGSSICSTRLTVDTASATTARARASSAANNRPLSNQTGSCPNARPATATPGLDCSRAHFKNGSAVRRPCGSSGTNHNPRHRRAIPTPMMAACVVPRNHFHPLTFTTDETCPINRTSAPGIVRANNASTSSCIDCREFKRAGIN